MITHEKLAQLIKSSIPADAYPTFRKLLKYIVDHNNQPEIVKLKTTILSNPVLTEIFRQAKLSVPKPGDGLLENYLTDRQLIEKLKISKRTLFTWRTKGILPASLYKGKYYYRIHDILALLNKNHQ